MFYDLIKSRRSYRVYTDEIIAEDLKKSIISAGLLAPSGKNNRHWQFVVVEDSDDLDLLSRAKSSETEFVRNSKFSVIVCGDSTINPDTWIEDASIAATYMQLQAEDLGIGSCWMQVRNRYHESGISSGAFIKREFSIPQYLSVVCVLAFGYPNEVRSEREYGNFETQVHFGKYK